MGAAKINNADAINDLGIRELVIVAGGNLRVKLSIDLLGMFYNIGNIGRSR